MKVRPILFSAPVVRAILEGQKTVTRRACKPQPSANAHITCAEGTPMGAWWETGGKVNRCPFGQSGDRLWVRESFGEVYDYCEHDEMPGCQTEHWHIAWKYRADGETPEIEDGFFEGWRPNIHMPREASRILLEITGVRVERLRSASDLELLDELGDDLENCDSVAGKEFSRVEHLQSAGAPLRMIPEMYGFKAFWDGKHGAGNFESNPWVWVVEFQKVTS